MRQSKFTGAAFATAVSLCVLATYTPTQAITTTFNPVDSVVTLGSPAEVDVIVYGFIPDPQYGNPIVMAGFEIFVDYDPTILDLDHVVFGASLGDPSTEATTNADDQNGRLTITETSSLNYFKLYDLQYADNFVAARLFFDTLKAGVSPLTIGFVLPGDWPNDLGRNIAYYFDAASTPSFFPDHYGDPGSVTVGTVPEPSSLLLIGCGAVGLMALKRRRRV